MNLEKLFKLQKELDDKIIDHFNLQTTRLISEKTLALEVEIGELANEVNCFKYWSNIKPSAKNVILERYVNCLHFILSLGLEYNFQDIKIFTNKSDSKITEQFLNIYVDITDFIVCSSKDHYITLFEDFLILSHSLNITEEEVENAYFKKNFKNDQRQVAGY